jgi:hypothetical protein
VSVTGTTTDGAETVVGASATGSFMLPPAKRPEVPRPETPGQGPSDPSQQTETVVPPAEVVEEPAVPGRSGGAPGRNR